VTNFTIRAAQQGDLTELADVLTESFHSHSGIFSWISPIFRLGVYEDLRNRLRLSPANYACLVAVDSSPRYSGSYRTVVGTVEIGLRTTHPWQPLSQQYPYLSNLAVREDCRRRGVAHQLLMSCERIVLDWGYQDIYLHVLENNYPARQLYARSGYQLRQTDFSWDCWLLGRPRRLFLNKRLSGIKNS
jgi:GNAT superfamily N-acetyltransferase